MSPWVCFAGNRHGPQRRTVSAEFLSHFQANYLSSAKYPLAITNILLQVFGCDLCIGYDIGCKFGTTVKNSPLGDLATRLNFRSLVGSFHGHAHGRICQLSHLVTYVEGLGLEDLEGCERFFSKSNALAASIRYASVFHRQQSTVTLKTVPMFGYAEEIDQQCSQVKLE